MYNTPPCYTIYMMGLVLKWIETEVGGSRICVVHRNIPGILAAITDVTSKAGLNIDNMTNKSRGDYAYTMLDTGGSVGTADAARLLDVSGIIRVRVV